MNEEPQALGRSGLPEDLRELLARYPRSDWGHHRNLGDMARFWLQRHAMFREFGAMLQTSVGDWREGRIETEGFVRFFMPRLNRFLGELEGHHSIEDHHYFPVFRAAEPKLARGFDLLDSDHHVIHDALHANAHAANALIAALADGGEAVPRAGDAHADENTKLIAMLMRHLEDEEDLIIPVILDRGEVELGIG